MWLNNSLQVSAVIRRFKITALDTNVEHYKMVDTFNGAPACHKLLIRAEERMA